MSESGYFTVRADALTQDAILRLLDERDKLRKERDELAAEIEQRKRDDEDCARSGCFVTHGDCAFARELSAAGEKP